MFRRRDPSRPVTGLTRAVRMNVCAGTTCGGLFQLSVTVTGVRGVKPLPLTTHAVSVVPRLWLTMQRAGPPPAWTDEPHTVFGPDGGPSGPGHVLSQPPPPAGPGRNRGRRPVVIGPAPGDGLVGGGKFGVGGGGGVIAGLAEYAQLRAALILRYQGHRLVRQVGVLLVRAALGHGEVAELD